MFSSVQLQIKTAQIKWTRTTNEKSYYNFCNVGCGKTEVETKTEIKSDIEKLEEENKGLEAELKEEKRKPDAEAKNKKLKEAWTEKLLTELGVRNEKGKKLTAEEKKLVGSYEAKKEETTVKLVLLENGKSEHWVNGEKKGEATWKLVEKEVHVLGRKRLFFGDGEDARVYKIEPNSDLTWIANIRDGKREDVPIGEQFTFKKIK